MPTDNYSQKLCELIFEIFKKHKLTSSEIEHLLSGIGPAPDSENLNEASCDIADIFLNENVSIIQASTVFNECYHMFSLKKTKQTSSNT